MTDDVLKRKGQCLCGKVGFALTLQSQETHVCHCAICQKYHGGPAISLSCAPKTVVINDQEGLLKWFQSSEWAERGFCSRCGSAMFSKLLGDDPLYYGVSAALLDKQDDLFTGEHIFVDKKPCYYQFDDDCKKLTEAEFLAQFS
jgi:hypothetical protein